MVIQKEAMERRKEMGMQTKKNEKVRDSNNACAVVMSD